MNTYWISSSNASTKHNYTIPLQSITVNC